LKARTLCICVSVVFRLRLYRDRVEQNGGHFTWKSIKKVLSLLKNKIGFGIGSPVKIASEDCLRAERDGNPLRFGDEAGPASPYLTCIVLQLTSGDVWCYYIGIGGR
jgi:hypothetical protein